MTISIRSRGALALAAGTAVAALALTSCAGADSAGGTGGGEAATWTITDQTAAPSGPIDEISWVSYSEPYTLDYAYAFDYADNLVLANMCESLLRLNADYSLTPSLATSFENPDPLTWVYEIRQGVTFHDGTEMTADDVLVSMTRHIDPEVGSSWYSVYQNVESIEKTGDWQITVKTVIPDSQFNLGMGGSAGVIESAATLEALGADYGNSTGGVNCTGPFQFDSWKSGESITMKAFDGYWNDELKANSDTFKFVFMNDANARVNALKSGEVDGSWMLPMDSVKQMEKAGNGDVLYGPSTAVSNLIVSNLEGPLGDIRVRQRYSWRLTARASSMRVRAASVMSPTC